MNTKLKEEIEKLEKEKEELEKNLERWHKAFLTEKDLDFYFDSYLKIYKWKERLREINNSLSQSNKILSIVKEIIKDLRPKYIGKWDVLDDIENQLEDKNGSL